MLRVCGRFLVFCFLGLLVLAVFAGQGFVVWGVGRDDAVLRVGEAEGALRGAFVAVVGAEGVGANVSGLLVRLNVAGGLFSSAEVALEDGNYSLAVEWASDCVGLADGVLGDAGVLKADAVAGAGGWWVTVSISAVGSVVFVGVLLLVWRLFRRFYGERFLKSRPEVAA